MTIQTGIWIDSKQAIIVLLEEEGHSIKKLTSEIEKKVRTPGEGKWFSRMGNQFFNFDRKKKAHQLRDSLAFYRDIQLEINNTDELVLFGPATRKLELEKYLIENGTPKSVISGVKTADSMTDNQVAAWVKKYFNR